MENSTVAAAIKPQACASGEVDGQINGRAGAAEFPVGKAEDGIGTPGATPYDLLSASLAACTAMTLRYYAQRKHYPLRHVDVAVSYQHRSDGGRDSFIRNITLSGNLSGAQRAKLVELADYCPVSQTLGVNSDIVTREENGAANEKVVAYTNYEDYLASLPLINLDPD